MYSHGDSSAHAIAIADLAASLVAITITLMVGDVGGGRRAAGLVDHAENGSEGAGFVPVILAGSEYPPPPGPVRG